MAENVIIYAGSNKAGKLRKQAIEREARRQGKKFSVSQLVWDSLKKTGSIELREDLNAADLLEQ